MLTYHPALDAYHAAFRMLRLLWSAENAEFERDKLLILDFYLTFPHLISEIRMPARETARKRAFKRLQNEYLFSGDPRAVFFQMRGLQDEAIQLLFGKGLLDTEKYRDDIIRLRTDGVPAALVTRLDERNESDSAIVTYLTSVVGKIPLTGQNGLKHRTGLLDHRYDAA